MKNTTGSHHHKPQRKFDAISNSIQEKFFDLTDKLQRNKNHEVLKSAAAFILVIFMGSLAVAGTEYMNRKSNDNRSQASIDKVDVEIAESRGSYETNSEFSLPVYLHPNGRRVTGLELKIELDNPEAAQIIEVIPNAEWARIMTSETQANRHTSIFISNCSGEDCTTTSESSLIATLRLRGSENGGSSNVMLTGTQASVLGESTNMIGDLVSNTITVATPGSGESPTPVPSPSTSPEPSASPTPSPTTEPPPTEDNEQPTVRFTSHETGGTVKRSSVVSLSADADDNVGVTRVEFFAYGKNVCRVRSAPYTCEVKIQGKPRHSIPLEVRAYDAAGNFGYQEISLTAE